MCSLRKDRERLRIVLRLPLLFYGAIWDDEKVREWAAITNGREATTKVMCDVIRAAIDAAREADGE